MIRSVSRKKVDPLEMTQKGNVRSGETVISRHVEIVRGSSEDPTCSNYQEDYPQDRSR